MPQHDRDFRTHATQACEDILIEASMIQLDRSVPDYEPIPLDMSWPLILHCVDEAAWRIEPDDDLLKKFLRAGIVPRLFSLFLNFPAPLVHDAAELSTHIDRVSAVDHDRAIEDLDVSDVRYDFSCTFKMIIIATVDLVSFVLLGLCVVRLSMALSVLGVGVDTDHAEAEQARMEWIKLMPRVVKRLSETTPWLNRIPKELDGKGPVQRWCLYILDIPVPHSSEKPDEASLDHAQNAIPLVCALSTHRSGLPEDDLVSVHKSIMLLGRYFNVLANHKVLQFASKQPIECASDRIAGVPFADLIRHFRDMAREINMSTVMPPAQCYLLEMIQMKIVAATILAAGDTAWEARSQALIDAFASEKMLTYCASLLRDPRAELVHTLAEEERFSPLDLVQWGEIVLPRCGMLINGAYKNGDNKLAREFVDSNFLFLLEMWSVKTPTPRVGMIQYTAERALNSLVSDPERQHTLQLQLAVIGYRIADHPSASRQVIDIWTASMRDSQFSEPPGDICSCIGCTSLEAASMRCSKCKGQMYCSKACQLTDWRTHKRHCKPSTSTSPLELDCTEPRVRV